MTVAMILLPLFVHVALVFVITFRLGYTRRAALQAGEVGPAGLTDPGAFPKPAVLAANSLRNQFELPVLFYVLTILALITRKADIAFLVLAWVFVLSRIGHAFVHVTSNELKLRFPLWLIGFFCLLLMWILFAAAILLNV